MERRKALALAASGAMLSAACAVVLGAGLLHATEEGDTVSAGTTTTVAPGELTTTTLAPVVVTETRDVYDTIVVPGSATQLTTPNGFGAEPATAPAAGAPATSSAQPSAPAPATATTTTTPSTTTTTRPPGVPADWPADRPIPPMPEGCRKPQLEDNGVWNCDH